MKAVVKKRSAVASPVFAVCLVLLVVAALATPAVSFAATTSDSSTTQLTATSNNSSQSDEIQSDNQSGNQMGTPPDMNSGEMPSMPEGMDSGSTQGGMMAGGPGGNSSNSMLLGAGIGLIALALGFVGGFFLGRSFGKKSAIADQKQLTPAVPSAPTQTPVSTPVVSTPAPSASKAK